MKRTFLVILLGVCACQDYGMSSTEKESLSIPVIDVFPLVIGFEDLPLGATTEELLTIENTGGASLTVSGIVLDGGGEFAIIEGGSVDSGPLRIEPDGSSPVHLAFTPAAPGFRDALLSIQSDDPIRPVVKVALSGEGLIPDAAIEPSLISFDGLYTGCVREDTYTLSNEGTAPLTASALSFVGTGASLVSSPDVPFVLDVGESTDVVVESAPIVAGLGGGELWIESDDPERFTRASLTYWAVDPVQANDDYDIAELDYIEILFYVDQSGSMSEDEEEVAENAELFIETLDDAARGWLGWRLMLITADDGCHSGSIIADTSEDPAALLREALSTTEKGRWTEAGLTLATNALSAENRIGCNAGFIQEGGLLTLIMVSDEPEQSSGYWSDYVEELQTLDPRVMISAVAGPLPRGCASASAGTGYYEASVVTGGLFLDFCSDWAENLMELGGALEEQDLSFVLHEEPEVSSIRVWIDDRERTSGWSFDAGRNSVVFEEDQAPEPGTTLHIEYLLEFSC